MKRIISRKTTYSIKADDSKGNEALRMGYNLFSPYAGFSAWGGFADSPTVEEIDGIMNAVDSITQYLSKNVGALEYLVRYYPESKQLTKWIKAITDNEDEFENWLFGISQLVNFFMSANQDL